MALAGFELVAAQSLNLYYIGGFVQGFGLLVIVYLGLELYNTKSLTILSSKTKLKTFLEIVFVFIVNILTIVLVAVLIRVMTYGNDTLINAAKKIAQYRVIGRGIGKEWYDCLIASLFCGFIVGIGINIYKRVSHPILKFLSIILATGIYVACGFEQVMTNTFYIVFADMFNGSTCLDIFITLIGNTAACFGVYYAFKFLFPPKVETNNNDTPNTQN